MTRSLPLFSLLVLLVGCGGKADLQGADPAESTDAGSASSGDVSSGGTADGTSGPGSSADGYSDDSTGGGSVDVPDGPVSLESASEGAGSEPPTPSSTIWGFGASWHIGSWFTIEGSAELQSFGPPRYGSASLEGRLVRGSGLEGGGWLWLELDHVLKKAADLSLYGGLSFWTRLQSGNGRLRVVMNTGGVFPIGDRELSELAMVEVEVGEEWQEVEIPFSDFDFDPSAVWSIEFNAGFDGEDFELWIDDLAFLPRRTN